MPDLQIAQFHTTTITNGTHFKDTDIVNDKHPKDKRIITLQNGESLSPQKFDVYKIETLAHDGTGKWAKFHFKENGHIIGPARISYAGNFEDHILQINTYLDRVTKDLKYLPKLVAVFFTLFGITLALASINNISLEAPEIYVGFSLFCIALLTSLSLISSCGQLVKPTITSTEPKKATFHQTKIVSRFCKNPT
jgi:hypothetical protein